MIEFSVDFIAKLLGGEIEGDGSVKVSQLGKIESAQPGSLTFLSNPKYEPSIYSTEASAVIVKRDFKPKKPLHTTLIKVADPYLSFTTLLEEYTKQLKQQKVGVENPSYIGENVSTGENIYRAAFSYIGDNCQLGKNVKIYPHAYLGDNVTVGDNSIIYSGAKIYSGTQIGARCTIHSGAVIGSDGFGFAPKEDGTYQTIPQVGNVIIGNDVSIGANTTVDCATLESTLIKDGVKLDNLIQIAHNVEIGENTVVAAQSGISGSTKVGKGCIIAGQVGIIGHLTIGDNVKVAAQSGIGKSLEANAIEMGSPSFDRKKYLRTYAVFKNLPDLTQRINELEKKLLNLPTTSSEDK